MHQVKEKIKKYLLRSIDEDSINEDEDIFDLGLVHSLLAIQLILFIEKEFGVEIPDDELNLEKLRTINQICDLVSQKLKKAS